MLGSWIEVLALLFKQLLADLGRLSRKTLHEVLPEVTNAQHIQDLSLLYRCSHTSLHLIQLLFEVEVLYALLHQVHLHHKHMSRLATFSFLRLPAKGEIIDGILIDVLMVLVLH